MSSRSLISGDTHVRAWTPLVIDPMGTSSTGTPGQRAANMLRLTWPWSRETPFDRPARRNPITAMLNGASCSSSGWWPRAMRSSNGTPHSSAQDRK